MVDVPMCAGTKKDGATRRNTKAHRQLLVIKADMLSIGLSSKLFVKPAVHVFTNRPRAK